MPKRSSSLAILLEAALVVVAGAGFALAANELSPKGLKLSRDYFPGGDAPAKPAPSAPPTASSTNSDSADAEIIARLKRKELQPISRAEAEKLFNTPVADAVVVLFVDARDEEHYAAGHIPRAMQLDPYHPEKELGDVLSMCKVASHVVVYCTGGDCEDADSTAILLRDNGIPNQILFVYGGGYTDWTNHALPVETASQNGTAAPGAKP